MKLFIVALLASLFVACGAAQKKPKAIAARITFYNNHEDRWGSRTSSGRRACEGHTVAAHPDFNFGTGLSIPALKPIIGSSDFVVEDRGTDVTAKKAASSGEYVFDVYLYAKNRKEGKRRIRHLGSLLTHADVTVH